jgi:protein SCO1/2
VQLVWWRYRCVANAVPWMLCIAAIVCAVTPSRTEAAPRQPRMGIFTKADARIDMALPFVDSSGEAITLAGAVPDSKPFILVPVFYQCPRLCGLTTSGVIDLINALSLKLGSDYRVIAYSFNPADTPAHAQEKRAKAVQRITLQPVAVTSFRFLTATSETISAINSQLDFRVRYADKELEHSSAIFIVRPDGAIVRYFAGVEFNPDRVAMALR